MSTGQYRHAAAVERSLSGADWEAVDKREFGHGTQPRTGLLQCAVSIIILAICLSSFWDLISVVQVCRDEP